MPTPAVAIAGAAAVLFAALMMAQRTLYGGALCLLAVLFQVAVLYFLFGSQLLGLMQVLVYAGAIMVLIVIAAMSAPPRLSSLWAETAIPRWLWGAVAALPLAELAVMGRLGAARGGDGRPLFAAAALEREMAAALFGPYALMTEAVGLLVLLASLSVLLERR